jgi:peptide-methionine (S)-S-oxide reductase
MEKAIFAAGCFWGVESAFAALPGVTATEVGYCNGVTAEPTYKKVCGGETGHAEAVQITFDPAKISYETLVSKFYELHDPTQVNRQGPDIGTQYRSGIFFTAPEQEMIARSVTEKLKQSGKFRKPIATIIEPAKTFWRAEEYHQKYFEKRGGGSCHI